MAGLRNALVGVPVVVLITLAVFAATPVLATCGGHDEVVTAAVLRCPRAVELLGDDAHPVRLGMACGSTKVSGASGMARWELPYTGSRGRGKVSFDAEKRAGDWLLHHAVLEQDGESIDILACSGGSPGAGGGQIVQTAADAASATFEGKVIRSTHPTILAGSICTGTVKRERGATTARATVTCKAGVGESGGAAPSGAVALYDGDASFSMNVGDPSRRDDDRSELDDSRTSDQDKTPGLRLSAAGTQGTLTVWDSAPVFEIVVAL